MVNTIESTVFTAYRVVPNLELNLVTLFCPVTADGGDIIDVSTIFSTCYGAWALDPVTGSFVSCSYTGTNVQLSNVVNTFAGGANKAFIVNVYGAFKK